LNGDGVRSLNISSGVQFDLYATGQKVDTGWVDPKDGLLALDRNHDGVINDGTELFGTSTDLPSGEKAADGYVALRALDTDGDGAISSTDSEFANLKVWVDSNSDGVSQAEELKTLDSLRVAKLYLDAESTSVKDNGNWVRLTSRFENADGETHEMADVWFVANKGEHTDKSSTARVNGLVEAIASFKADDAGNPRLEPLPGAQPAATTLTVSANVGGIVDLLKQFDSNGNPISNSVQIAGVGQASCAGASVNLQGIQNPSNTGGFLATEDK
jgi:hypothetical protein